MNNHNIVDFSLTFKLQIKLFIIACSGRCLSFWIQDIYCIVVFIAEEFLFFIYDWEALFNHKIGFLGSYFGFPEKEKLLPSESPKTSRLKIIKFPTFSPKKKTEIKCCENVVVSHILTFNSFLCFLFPLPISTSSSPLLNPNNNKKQISRLLLEIMQKIYKMRKNLHYANKSFGIFIFIHFMVLFHFFSKAEKKVFER